MFQYKGKDRWTASESKHHPFLSGKRFTRPFSPSHVESKFHSPLPKQTNTLANKNRQRVMSFYSPQVSHAFSALSPPFRPSYPTDNTQKEVFSPWVGSMVLGKSQPQPLPSIGGAALAASSSHKYSRSLRKTQEASSLEDPGVTGVTPVLSKFNFSIFPKEDLN